MKKLVAILICGVTLSMTACGSTATEETPVIEKEEITEEATEETTEEAVEEAPVETPAVSEIANEISSSVELVSPMTMSDDFIFNYYGIDTSTLSEYSFVTSEEATSAETVIIVKVADASQTDTIKGQLQAILDEKAGEMEDYLPEEYEIVKKASVTVKGDYVYLVISNSADAIQAILDKYIK